jgi:nucleoside-diphosphate-sugar epimerase
VENLADAIVSAGTQERAWNEDYNITDGVGETLHEYFTAVAKQFGVKPKFMSLPSFIAKPFATLVEGCYKLVRSKKGPLITRFSTYQNCSDYHFSIQKAKDKFGFEPKVSMEEGIRRTVEWFNTL